MTNEINAAAAKIAETLAENPELLEQEINMLKRINPDINEDDLKSIVEKVKNGNFNRQSLQNELSNIIAKINK